MGAAWTDLSVKKSSSSTFTILKFLAKAPAIKHKNVVNSFIVDVVFSPLVLLHALPVLNVAMSDHA